MTDDAQKLPLLSAAVVLLWSGANEVKKGRSYVRHLDQLTAEPLDVGWQLGGHAYGTDDYRTSATLEKNRVARARCSCPVGGRGGCKHVAALLTRFSESPGDFQRLSPLSEMLAPLSAEALRGLVEQLLVAAPDLRVLAERLASGRAPQGSQSVSITSLFFQLERRQPQNHWDDDEGLDTTALDGVMDEADVLWETQPEQALAIYLEMLEQIEQATTGWAEAYGDPFEELFQSAVDGVLSLVGEARLAEPVRSQAVAAIFNIKNLLGLVGSDELADFAAELSQTEHAGLLRHLQQAHDRSRFQYEREQLAQTLLKLIPKACQTPAQREALLLSNGDDVQVAEYFLTDDPQTGQPDLAQRRKLLNYFTQTSPLSPLEPLFGLFEHHAAESVLEQILAVRLGQPHAFRHFSPEHHWLLSRYAATQRREQAFELAWKGLLATASPEWERLAQSVSLDWARDWKKALAAFEQRPGLNGLGNAQLLALLLEGDHDLSEVEAYDRRHQGRYASAYIISGMLGRSVVSMREQLAQQLGEVPDHHARAADIYLDLAAQLTSQRGREQYRAAAQHLRRLAALIGKEAAREKIAAFAGANKNLRALQEELHKARLL
ncbi:SWIM zinc finger family protein [Deinococcus rubellus]|uniref:SWIM zinc finger family protein n=1 Tax=Deinococcus rubellus TaxID=1889240 RepID=A0ABY5YHG1_9DEIO|nr:SWIM zinc finger family protein [Deinococcus rubellus]UWX63714.1 SWIM zinc finger family protein [Deinococcus rubellus]